MCNNTATAIDMYLWGEEQVAAFFETEYNVVFFDPQAPRRCHTVSKHGPTVTEQERTQREKFAQKKKGNFNFTSEDTLLYARHFFCETFKEEMEKARKEGKPFGDKMRCPDAMRDKLGSTLYPDGTKKDECSYIYGRFYTRDGVLYEQTLFGKP